MFSKDRGPLPQYGTFVRLSSRVPPIVDETIRWLRRHNATTVEGLFRVSGLLQDINTIKKRFDKGKKVDLDKLSKGDVHTVAGVLKLYLRELDIPLLTFELYDCFGVAMELGQENQRINCLRTVISLLPPANKEILTLLLRFLKEVCADSDKNQMGASNLSLIFAPSILRPYQTGDATADMNLYLTEGPKAAKIVEYLITHYDGLFRKGNKEEAEGLKKDMMKNSRQYRQFYATLKRGSMLLATNLVKERRTLFEGMAQPTAPSSSSSPSSPSPGSPSSSPASSGPPSPTPSKWRDPKFYIQQQSKASTANSSSGGIRQSLGVPPSSSPSSSAAAKERRKSATYGTPPSLAGSNSRNKPLTTSSEDLKKQLQQHEELQQSMKNKLMLRQTGATFSKLTPHSNLPPPRPPRHITTQLSSAKGDASGAKKGEEEDDEEEGEQEMESWVDVFVSGKALPYCEELITSCYDINDWLEQ
ncbi:Beta-chimaerin [Balamuthia mandrillaris]